MPIKFRCQHCRQFLGISRTKAGEVVDCPTCGRAVRVPNLDGSVAPIPQPKLNVNELAGALDELARIGGEGGLAESEGSGDESAPVHEPVVVKELAPLPSPEPISVEAPLPAEPVDIHAKKPTAAPPEPAGAVSSAAMLDSRSTAAAKSVPFPGVLKTTPVLGTLIGTAVLMFAAGWFLGGLGRGSEPGSDNGANAGGETSDGSNSNPVTQITVYHPDDWKPAVKGQIQYHKSGGNEPDDGARILVLPDSRTGGLSKLPVEGFHAAANEADFRVALAGLRELGGNAALADEQGKFEIRLPPSAGSFDILVISKNLENDFSTEIPASTQVVLQRYFSRPNALIRKLAFKHGKLKFSGDSVETWNHTFE